MRIVRAAGRKPHTRRKADNAQLSVKAKKEEGLEGDISRQKCAPPLDAGGRNGRGQVQTGGAGRIFDCQHRGSGGTGSSVTAAPSPPRLIRRRIIRTVDSVLEIGWCPSVAA